MEDTDARVALVTGGSSGIGRATVERLARDGMAVGVHYSGNNDGPTADAYSNGPYAGIEEDINAGLAALEPEDADVADVGRAIADVVAAPRGQRPFRVHVMTGPEGAHVADPVVDRLRAELLRRVGLGDLLTVRAPAVNEERS